MMVVVGLMCDTCTELLCTKSDSESLICLHARVVYMQGSKDNAFHIALHI